MLLLTVFLYNNLVEIRDFFEPGGSERLNNVLKRYSVEQPGNGRFQTAEEKSRASGPNHTIVQSALVLARAVSKSEQNKSKFQGFILFRFRFYFTILPLTGIIQTC